MLFVSHATADDAAVDTIYNHLIAAGFTPDDFWIDHKRIKPGQDWHQEIQKALTRPDCLGGIFVLSPRSVNRPEIENEWRTLLRLLKPLFVVYIETVSDADYPYRLNNTQYVDLRSDYDQGIATLVSALRDHAQLSELAIASPILETIKLTADRLDPMLTIPMYGRESDLQSALKLVKEAPLFITGIGGLGKSRLAWAIVNAPDAGWKGVIWHRCTEATSTENIYELLRTHYDLDSRTQSREAIKRARSDGRNLLVVIDNAEVVTDDDIRAAYIDLIHDLWQAGTGVSIVVTSRIEWRKVRPQKLKLNRLDADSAARSVEAFTKRFGVSQALDFSAIASAAQMYPKLIELAAGKLEWLAEKDVIDELIALKSPDMQDALTEMIRVTVAQMTVKRGEASLAALRRLAVCRGGFTLDAAKTILEKDDPLPLLHILTEYRFVRFDGSRYDIDDLVIKAVGLDETAKWLHYKYYFSLAQSCQDSTDPLKYTKLDIERENLVLDFAFTITQSWREAFLITTACHDYLVNRGLWEQLSNWYKKLEESLPSEIDEFQTAILRLHYATVLASYPFEKDSARVKRAIGFLRDSLEYFFSVNDIDNMISCHANLGVAYSVLSRLEDPETNLMSALRQHMQEIRLIQENGTKEREIAVSLLRLGNVYIGIADYNRKTQNLERARMLFRDVFRYHRHKLSWHDRQILYNSLGNCHLNLLTGKNGKTNRFRAVIYYQRALAEISFEVDPIAYAGVHSNLGRIFVAMGYFDQALRCLGEAQRCYRQLEMTTYIEQTQKWIEATKSRMNEK